MLNLCVVTYSHFDSSKRDVDLKVKYKLLCGVGEKASGTLGYVANRHFNHIYGLLPDLCHICKVVNYQPERTGLINYLKD